MSISKINTNSIAAGASPTMTDLTLSGSLFLGGTGSANELDDYEEGTWTATLNGGSSNPSTPVTTTATYTKIGRLVYITAFFSNFDNSGASGRLEIVGVPFSAASSNVAAGAAAIYNLDIPSGRSSLSTNISGTTLFVTASGDVVTWQDVSHATGTGRYLQVTATYTV